MSSKIYSWTVIGAGCAGIVAIAKLLDEKILPNDILWIDEDFNGGEINSKWYEVPGNTIVETLNDSFYSFKSINYKELKSDLKNLNPNDVCSLGYLADALKDASKELLSSGLNTYKSKAISICDKSGIIEIETLNKTFKTKKLILATGAKQAQQNTNKKSLNLEIALCPTKLAQENLQNKKIGVIGSSHSAILVLKNLIDANAENIVNFYRSFTKYAMPYNDKIIYDNTGLKGLAAAWAKENLETSKHIKRVHIQDPSYSKEFSECDLLIHAMGFESRNIPINGVTNYKHNPYHGTIAPNIYGIGIAYPEIACDDFGYTEQNVGMLKFVKYINKVFPIWQM
ncbi:hypothetical protein [Francisella frigiditurris]|uniref:Pyridine nucleotide-disulfide oxidoreductase family protein n=1 Tax=Francisella frigiditurris TaxID=1542390 RepID=A0A1J0KW21_9GAMM|nr:hypothetical protein [Francisella frigiditurris]APC97820.1 pyridine nucleotide-disulfide oxidoreductase family protein [Francisella frigiditurris]